MRIYYKPSDDAISARYNIAPTQACPVVVRREGRRQLELMPWRLGTAKPCINARAETLMLKPTFREPFKTGRCLVLADGFYEWRGKDPVRFARPDGQPFAMAGLFAKEGFAVITTEPNGLVRPIHDRMPVVLEPEAEQLWLDPDARPESLTAALRPAPDGILVQKPASPALNKASHEGPDCWVQAQAELF